MRGELLLRICLLLWGQGLLNILKAGGEDLQSTASLFWFLSSSLPYKACEDGRYYPLELEFLPSLRLSFSYLVVIGAYVETVLRRVDYNIFLVYLGPSKDNIVFLI
jgi:hypothetical protein